METYINAYNYELAPGKCVHFCLKKSYLFPVNWKSKCMRPNQYSHFYSCILIHPSLTQSFTLLIKESQDFLVASSVVNNNKDILLTTSFARKKQKIMLTDHEWGVSYLNIVIYYWRHLRRHFYLAATFPINTKWISLNVYICFLDVIGQYVFQIYDWIRSKLAEYEQNR